ncbi:hypothetical protein NL676_029272 [Syzygium grande]|nr:hypothetical protein NL676_029272 [Syzygium grande]
MSAIILSIFTVDPYDSVIIKANRSALPLDTLPRALSLSLTLSSRVLFLLISLSIYYVCSRSKRLSSAASTRPPALLERAPPSLERRRRRRRSSFLSGRGAVAVAADLRMADGLSEFDFGAAPSAELGCAARSIIFLQLLPSNFDGAPSDALHNVLENKVHRQNKKFQHQTFIIGDGINCEDNLLNDFNQTGRICLQLVRHEIFSPYFQICMVY